jgi:hypothetical protein
VAMEGCFQERTVLQDPVADRRMIDRHPRAPASVLPPGGSLRGYATYHRTQVRMMPFAKWAPLRLTITAPPLLSTLDQKGRSYPRWPIDENSRQNPLLFFGRVCSGQTPSCRPHADCDNLRSSHRTMMFQA